MNLIVYMFAVLLCFVKNINGLKTSKLFSGNINVEKVCNVHYRVFTRVGVSSPSECATACIEPNGCDAIVFSAVNGSCTGCMKLTDVSSALVPSTANVYYQLVNANFSAWTYGTSAYTLDVSRTMSFNNAKIYCQLFGAHVVVPGSKGEQDFLADQISKMPPGVSESWIGITETEIAKTFRVEHSGEMLNYTNWFEGELSGNQRCVDIWRGAGWKWYDTGCFSSKHVVCEHD